MRQYIVYSKEASTGARFYVSIGPDASRPIPNVSGCNWVSNAMDASRMPQDVAKQWASYVAGIFTLAPVTRSAIKQTSKV